MKKLLISLLLLLFLPPTVADDVFKLSMQVDQVSQKYGFANAEKMFDRFDGISLSEAFPEYVEGVSAIQSQIDYRGIPMLMAFSLNSSVLVFDVPELGIHETFDGNGSRDRAKDLFVDFLKGDGGKIINRINKRLAQRSAIDPFAGNPSSLMGTMVSDAFTHGTNIVRNPVNVAASSHSDENIIGAGIQFGSLNQGSKNVHVWNLPLEYTWAEEDGHNLTLKMPISMVDAEGAKAYKVGLGLAYQMPINQHWLVTPSLEYGLMGSEDMLSAGQLVSVVVTSLYTFAPVSENVSISLGNMAGYYKTLPTKVGDVDIDPDITSQVLKNGIIVDTKAEIFNTPVNIQYYLSDTRFYGDNLYAEHYNEIGFSVTPVQKGGIYNYLGLAFTYLFSSSATDINGLKLGITYTF